jgi:hypothetical protein
MNEIWKDIPGTNGIYQASNTGQIRSIDRLVKHNYGGLKLTKGRILKQSKQRNGYLACPIFYNGIEKRRNIHRLIISAFLGESNLTVNHKNGIKSDNNLSNLEYCTLSENAKHSFRIGLSCIDGEKHPSSRLSNEEAKTIFKLANSGSSTMELARKYGVVASVISNIKFGRSYAKATNQI